MKTIKQALIDEIIYPIPEGLVDNKIIERGLNAESPFDLEISKKNEYKGAVADCLIALVQSVNFSEADKSIGGLSDEAKKSLHLRANAIYKAIGEPEIVSTAEPIVYIEN